MLFALGREASEQGSTLLWGYSPARLMLLAAAGILTAAFIVLCIRAAEGPIGRWLSSPRTLRGMLLLCAALFGAVLFFFLIPVERLGRAAGYLGHVRPLALWVMAAALQTAIGLLIWTGFRVRWDAFRNRKPALAAAGVFLGLLGVLAAVILRTRIGLAPDTSGWNAPGTPVLFSQVLLACAIASATIFLSHRFGARRDAIIGAGLWLGAALLWLGAPSRPTFFSPEPGPPNFQPYPFSDSAYYDLVSQIILNGKSLEMGLMRKPLYDFFLAALHVFAGQDYGLLVTLQVLVLAVIPVLMYLLAVQLGGRLAGVIAALLVILREYNSILLTNVIEVSSARLLLSDVPSMLLMLAAALLMVRWLSRPEAGWRLAAAAGAVLGLLILIRAQTLALVPVVLAGSLLVHRTRWKLFAASGGMMLLGAAMVLLPWMWRNQAVAGQWSIEDTGSYMEMMVGSFADDPAMRARGPDESNADYDARLRVIVLRGMFLHPERILGYTSAHFMHNQVQSLLHLPVTASFQTPRAYVRSLPFWNDWTAPWPVAMIPLVIVNLLLLALGLGRAWSRQGAVSLAPVLLSLGYSLTVALARFSGWRYILPADWVVILFYAIGISQVLQLTRGVFKKLFPKIKPGAGLAAPATAPRAELALIAVLAAVGLSLPISEALIPGRYPDLDADQKLASYGMRPEDSGLPSVDALRRFMDQPNAVALHGVAMYPRYFEEGQGVAEHSWSAYVTREYRRLGFLLLDADWEQVILALPESPVEFPHAQEVLVIGCQTGDTLDALLVIPAAETGSVFQRIPAPDPWVCPLEIP